MDVSYLNNYTYRNFRSELILVFIFILFIINRNGYKYDVALLLSVFFGFLGADRFYLGHVGMGALKCCTLGFFFIGHLIDM